MRLQQGFRLEDVITQTGVTRITKLTFHHLQQEAWDLQWPVIVCDFPFQRTESWFASLSHPMQVFRKKTALQKLKIKESIYFPINLLGRLKKISLRDRCGNIKTLLKLKSLPLTSQQSHWNCITSNFIWLKTKTK